MSKLRKKLNAQPKHRRNMKSVLRLLRRKWVYNMQKVYGNNSRILTTKQVDWAYKMWCIGYTQKQIADALNVCSKTVERALKGKPRIRPTLKYPKTC